MHITRHTLSVPLLAGGILCLLLISCQPPDEGMSREEMNDMVDKTLVAWNTGEFTHIDEVYSPDYVRHSPGNLDDIVGLDAYREYITRVRSTYPDFNVAVDELTGMPGGSVLRWTVTGTQEGPMMELPPTGASITLPGVSVSTVVDGKITEEWVYWNAAATMEQLGFTFMPPAMEEAAEGE